EERASRRRADDDRVVEALAGGQACSGSDDVPAGGGESACGDERGWLADEDHEAQVFEGGRIVLSGEPSTLARDPPVRAAYLGGEARGPLARAPLPVSLRAGSRALVPGRPPPRQRAGRSGP